jgi:hypothetical protein
MLRYGTIGAYPRHDNFTSPSISSDGMRHTFSHSNNEISECDTSVNFYQGSPVSFPDHHIIGGPGIVRKNVTLKTGEGFFSDLLL